MSASGGRAPRSMPTMAEMVAFGGISDGLAGVRSSDRIRAQPLADATQLQRAIHLAQQRDSPGMLSNSKLSFISITNDQIIARASRLGISLGESPSAISSSINLIK